MTTGEGYDYAALRRVFEEKGVTFEKIKGGLLTPAIGHELKDSPGILDPEKTKAEIGAKFLQISMLAESNFLNPDQIRECLGVLKGRYGDDRGNLEYMQRVAKSVSSLEEFKDLFE